MISIKGYTIWQGRLVDFDGPWAATLEDALGAYLSLMEEGGVEGAVGVTAARVVEKGTKGAVWDPIAQVHYINPSDLQETLVIIAPHNLSVVSPQVLHQS